MNVGVKMSPSTGDARQPSKVEIKRVAGRFEVWLCADGERPTLAGSIGARLAADAYHHGQDLVEELVERGRGDDSPVRLSVSCFHRSRS